MSTQNSGRTPTRTAVRRSATAIGAVAALTAAFVAGTQVGGTPEPRDPRGAFVPLGAPLTVSEDCDALLDSYQSRALALVGTWGWENAAFRDGAMPAIGRVFAQAEDTAAAPAPSRATTSETGTNVQETGVDEPDVVKTDGTSLFTIDDGELATHDVTGDEPEQLATLDLPDLGDGWTEFGPVRSELLLVDDTLVAVGAPARPLHRDRPVTRIVVVDVSDPAAPEVVDEASVTGHPDAVRLHGDVVRVVVSTGLPQLDFLHPGGGVSEFKARGHNREAVESTTLADWLPQRDDEAAVACDAVAVPDDADSTALGTTTVLAFDPADGIGTDAVAMATTAATSYFSTDRLHLATHTRPFSGRWSRGPWGTVTPPGSTQDDGRTRLWSFALDGPETTFAAAGEVDGAVADRWSMDSVDGVLRVAVGPTSATGNFNSVVTLAERGGDLVEVGRVDKLGVDEEIKAVRWFDDLALLVTFRQVDPLYAIDLSDPENPQLLGELKIPGFSEYLHPLGSDRMIGMGSDADERTGQVHGAQAALFDVTDLGDLRRLDVVSYPRDSHAAAADDPRQFLWVPGHRTALTVVTEGWYGRTGWLSQLQVRGGKLTETRTEVEYGNDVDRVRLVPLSRTDDEGVVALVTRERVEFVEVAGAGTDVP